jgi:hypothetical protein
VPSNDKSVPTLVSELWELVLTYLKQETLVPIKGLGTFLKWGLIGSVLLALGLPLMALGLLRALQTEIDTFDDGWSFVPYAVVLVVCGVVAALAARSIGSARRAKESA